MGERQKESCAQERDTFEEVRVVRDRLTQMT